jgi:hypothetical protein
MSAGWLQLPKRGSMTNSFFPEAVPHQIREDSSFPPTIKFSQPPSFISSFLVHQFPIEQSTNHTRFIILCYHSLCCPSFSLFCLLWRWLPLQPLSGGKLSHLQLSLPSPLLESW